MDDSEFNENSDSLRELYTNVNSIKKSLRVLLDDKIKNIDKLPNKSIAKIKEQIYFYQEHVNILNANLSNLNSLILELIAFLK